MRPDAREANLRAADIVRRVEMICDGDGSVLAFRCEVMLLLKSRSRR